LTNFRYGNLIVYGGPQVFTLLLAAGPGYDAFARLTRLNNPAAMRTFDITPHGRQIVFDRLRENSDILLIDLATKQDRP